VIVKAVLALGNALSQTVRLNSFLTFVKLKSAAAVGVEPVAVAAVGIAAVVGFGVVAAAAAAADFADVAADSHMTK
jgi:hypothetical protein